MQQHTRFASRQAFLATAAAFGATRATGFAQAAGHLTVGAAAIDGATGLVAAVRNGYFRDNGITVNIVVSSGSAGAAAVAGGSMQFASSNLVTLMQAHLNGLPFQIVAPSSAYDTNNPTQVLIVRNDSGITKAADLNGKTIGVTSIGDLLSVSTLAWIDKNGGDSATVKLIEVPPTASAATLDAGRVQAASLAEPFLSEALGTGTVHIFAKIFDAIGPRFLQAAYFGVPNYINANPDVVRRFARALIQGDIFANEHPDKTLPWMIEYTKINPEIERKARRERFGESIDPAEIQLEIDALVKLKVLAHGFDARDMISPVVLNLRK